MPLELEESQLPRGWVPDRDVHASITFGCCGNVPQWSTACDTPLSLLVAMSELPGRASYKPVCHHGTARESLGTTSVMIWLGKGMGREQPHKPYHPVMGMAFSNPLSKPFFISFSPVSISNASGNLVIQEVAVQPLTQDMLLHEVCHPWDAWGCPLSFPQL